MISYYLCSSFFSKLIILKYCGSKRVTLYCALFIRYLLKSSSGSGGVSKLLTHDAVGLAIGVCKGLIHLHQNGILHKDIATRNCS